MTSYHLEKLLVEVLSLHQFIQSCFLLTAHHVCCSSDYWRSICQASVPKEQCWLGYTSYFYCALSYMVSVFWRLLSSKMNYPYKPYLFPTVSKNYFSRLSESLVTLTCLSPLHHSWLYYTLFWSLDSCSCTNTPSMPASRVCYIAYVAQFWVYPILSVLPNSARGVFFALCALLLVFFYWMGKLMNKFIWQGLLFSSFW